MCQVTSMDAKNNYEDEAVTLLCSSLESWDHLVTCIRNSTIGTLDYDTIVGSLFSKEMGIK